MGGFADFFDFVKTFYFKGEFSAVDLNKFGVEAHFHSDWRSRNVGEFHANPHSLLSFAKKREDHLGTYFLEVPHHGSSGIDIGNMRKYFLRRQILCDLPFHFVGQACFQFLAHSLSLRCYLF